MPTEVSPPDVILLRSADQPDPYVQAFEAVGVRAACKPVLTFEFPNDEALRERLRTPERYGALVATSPRVGRALHRIFDDEGTVHAAWKGGAAFAVGPKTADELRALAFDVQGEDAGSAAALADHIAEADPPSPVLFLCGDRRRDALPDGLRAADIEVEELTVYVTRTRADLTLPSPGDDTWLAFFSPSGVEAVQAAEAGPLSEYHLAAIGPTTAEALDAAGLPPSAVAETPSPDGLVTAILGAQKSWSQK